MSTGEPRVGTPTLVAGIGGIEDPRSLAPCCEMVARGGFFGEIAPPFSLAHNFFLSQRMFFLGRRALASRGVPVPVTARMGKWKALQKWK